MERRKVDAAQGKLFKVVALKHRRVIHSREEWRLLYFKYGAGLFDLPDPWECGKGEVAAFSSPSSWVGRRR